MSATVLATESSAPNDPPPRSQGRSMKRRPKRPAISIVSPRKWCRPLAPGVVPAYDLALELLEADSTQIKSEAQILRERIRVMEEQRVNMTAEETEAAQETVKKMDDELETSRAKLRILEVQAEVNLPDVRWRVANAMPDMKKPVDRHLLEQKWRKDGDLDLLMERIYQMRVVPDLLSSMHPSIHVRITANTLGMVSGKANQIVEPGSFLLPRQTFAPPKIYANVFHTDTRLYTLILLDPDVPDEAKASYTTYLHWMQPNIPLSASHTARILNLNNHTKYIPPHPQQGTKYHRYVLLLLQQPPLGASEYSLNLEARAKTDESTSMHLDIPVVSNKQRKGFSLRSFMREWSFDMRKGGGAHMWREVWDEHVSAIYKNILGTPEPRYRLPRKSDLAPKQSRKYIS